MAAIDKMYVTGKQLREAIVWAREHGPAVFENGHRTDLLAYIAGYNEDEVNGTEPIIDGRTYVLWNTPCYLDRWLAKNCPLEFVQDSLKHYNYSPETVEEMKAWEYPGPFCKPRKNMKLKVLQSPRNIRYIKWYMTKKIPCWRISVYPDTPDGSYWRNRIAYDAQLDTWIEDGVGGQMPYTDEYYDIKWYKNIHLKTLFRLIRRWNIPAGYIVECDQIKYKMPSFKIRVK